MKLNRTVVQEAGCDCNNVCEDGDPTPLPLHDEHYSNVMGDYCENCRFLTWYNRSALKLIEEKNNKLIYERK